MAQYVYGCPNNPGHTQITIEHGMNIPAMIICTECGAVMRRVPQSFNFSIPPMDAGLRHTIDIHNYNKEKYLKNKSRREANDEAHRKANER